MPDGVCDYYANGLFMCLGSPHNPVIKFDVDKMILGPDSDEACPFCQKGKNIDRDFLWGKNWEGTYQFRKGGM